MKAKKTVAIGMAALMMSGVFAGCGSGAGNDSVYLIKKRMECSCD